VSTRELAASVKANSPDAHKVSDPGAKQETEPSSYHILQLQRRYGNRYVQRLLNSGRHSEGHADLSGVRVHRDAQAVTLGRALIARAFTGQPSPSAAGSVPSVQRQGGAESNLTRLNAMLDRINVPEGDVITLLGELTPAEKTTVLAGGYRKRIASALNVGEMVRAVNNLGPTLVVKLDWVRAAASTPSAIDYPDIKGMITAAPQDQKDAMKSWRNFFVAVCSNKTMAEAVDDLGWELALKLEWMKAEGSDWSLVRARIVGTTDAPQKLALYDNTDMREFFVDVCNDAEMAEAVALLGGTLQQQLTWMQAEGSNWRLVKARIQATTDAAQKLALYDSTEWRNFFVDVCNDEEMAEAVALLGGTLLQQLTWMKAEGSNWSLVRARIQATSDAAQKLALYDSTEMRAFFVDVCNDNEMAEAVALLGGTLLQQLTWMKAEGSNWKLVKARILATTDAAQKVALYGDRAMLDFFVDVCNDEEMAEAVALLGGTLLQQLTWMKAEGSNWKLVKARIAATADPAEKIALYGDPAMLKFFVDVCNDAEMAEAVALLGGTLLQQLTWMKAEGSNWKLVKARIVATADLAQKAGIYSGGVAMRDFFVDICNDDEMAEAVDLLGFTLAQKLDWMIEEDTNYAAVKTRISAASAADKAAVLADQALLRRLKGELSWNNFAKSVELLGRLPPTAGAMLGDATVTAALNAAFTASSPAITLPQHNPANPVGPCNPPAGTLPPPGVHEEVGWVYLNLITGNLATRRGAGGGQANGSVGGAPEVADSVLVGAFHTHPNVGPCWGALFPSGTDTATANSTGVPMLIIGAFPTVAATQTISTGPAQRLHLAGPRTFPGATGGEAPQATIDGTYDEL
jgi:hypothetical protein